jgi:TolB-like protein/Flp pilus assembly protein TadD/tRNA A-37 threonylcarbamoyl transferase component Bud32
MPVMQQNALAQAFADRYAIEEEIGRGGAATVYAAVDLKHSRRVALKVLRPEYAAGLGPERFLREIRIAAGLSHPNILPLHDSGEAAGLLYYVMPLVEGATLRERIVRERQLPLSDALAITSEVADALDCAHRHGIVHRDVKPENILFMEGHATVSDFGVASAREHASSDQVRTDPGLAIGTPDYMSPEACAGEPVDTRSDQYSLACVLYEMLAGHPPFTAASPQAVALRQMGDTPPPLATVRPDLPGRVTRAVARALAKAPADRFPSAPDFVAALRAEDDDTAQERSLAVLPFANTGGLPEDDPLADGITDELISALNRLEGLRVASRTSVYALRGRGIDVPELARQLHVGTVLEGSVRRAGHRLRVAVQLVSARDGYLLWSERYDRDLADVFAIQDEIAQNVARALKIMLRGDTGSGLTRVPTRDMRAYEYWLRGRQYLRQTRRKSLRFAREMFERAIAADARFGLAWAGVAESCALLNMYYPEEDADLGLADEASTRALALAPDVAAVHASRGFVLWRLKRRDEAVAAFETAERLDPAQFEARYFHARLCFTEGDIARAAVLFEDAARAQEDYQARFFAAQSYTALGRSADAEAAYRRALHVVQEHLEFNPDDPRAATMCAVCYCRLGVREEGLRWAERARTIDPDDPGVIYNVACLYALEGRVEDALDCLEQAARTGFGGQAWIAHDPDLDSVRDHPRFQALFRH